MENKYVDKGLFKWNKFISEEVNNIVKQQKQKVLEENGLSPSKRNRGMFFNRPSQKQSSLNIFQRMSNNPSAFTRSTAQSRTMKKRMNAPTLDEIINKDLLEQCRPDMRRNLEDLFSEELSRHDSETAPMSRTQKEQEDKFKQEKQIMDFEDYGGVQAVLDDLFKPTEDNFEEDSVYKLKNNCKDFYNKKDRMARKLVQTLDSMSQQRPRMMKLKSEKFKVREKAVEMEDTQQVKANVIYDIDSMRLDAEAARLALYKNISQFLPAYFRVCKRLSMINLDQFDIALYLMDYVKILIETAAMDHLETKINRFLGTLSSEEMMDLEVVKTLRVFFEEFGFLTQDGKNKVTKGSMRKKELIKVLVQKVFELKTDPK